MMKTMKNEALVSYGSSLSQEEVANLLRECSTLFRVKQRVNMLMTKERDNIERVRHETQDIIRSLARNYGPQELVLHPIQLRNMIMLLTLKQQIIQSWNVLVRFMRRLQANSLKNNTRMVSIMYLKNIMNLLEIMVRKVKMKVKGARKKGKW